MVDKTLTVKGKLAGLFELREDMTDPSVPRIEFVGNRRVTIEGAKNIVEYGLSHIKLNLGKFSVSIKGRDLYIQNYNKLVMTITGYIEEMQYMA